MVVLLHGAAGAWDELAIAVVALAVLWGAVKLAGRKPATDDEGEDEDGVAAQLDDKPEGEHDTRRDPAHSSTKGN
jgi:hypothetical protein